jgi:hypothetical protein
MGQDGAHAILCDSKESISTDRTPFRFVAPVAQIRQSPIKTRERFVALELKIKFF